MRTCTNCGSQFSDNELICPRCGQEVQLVPDYVTIESHIQEDQIKKEEKRRAFEEEQEREDALRRRKNQIRRNVILVVLLCFFMVAGIAIAVTVSTVNKRNNSFEYQYTMALENYNDGALDKAEEFVARALELKADDRNARLLAAEIYMGLNRTEAAISVLDALAKDFPTDPDILELLLPYYAERRNVDTVRELLLNSGSDELKMRYVLFLPGKPVITPDGGAYKETTSVSISVGQEGTIHYTIDGTPANEQSPIYYGAFELGEGKTVVNAVLVTEVGAVSEEASASFTVELEVPPTPAISPKSGRYMQLVDRSGEDADEELVEQYILMNPKEKSDFTINEITVVVPNGYTCRYSFDRKPDKTSPIYQGPVPMRPGEHVFYAVLESKDGRFGGVASATFVFSKTTVTPLPTVTPTPTSTPTPTPDVNSSSEKENPSETTETPTPEPGSEPSEQPSPEPTEEPADGGGSGADASGDLINT